MVLIALKHSVCIDNWETIFLKKILSALKSDKWAALILQKVQLTYYLTMANMLIVFKKN